MCCSIREPPGFVWWGEHSAGGWVLLLLPDTLKYKHTSPELYSLFWLVCKRAESLIELIFFSLRPSSFLCGAPSHVCSGQWVPEPEMCGPWTSRASQGHLAAGWRAAQQTDRPSGPVTLHPQPHRYHLWSKLSWTHYGFVLNLIRERCWQVLTTQTKSSKTQVEDKQYAVISAEFSVEWPLREKVRNNRISVFFSLCLLLHLPVTYWTE